MQVDTLQEVNGYERHYVDDMFVYYKSTTAKSNRTFAQEVRESLCSSQKYLHFKFLYDKKGSELFERICELPEYYLTRKETEILQGIGDDLLSQLGTNFYSLVELGSGSSTKTKIILDYLKSNQHEILYYPIDISVILTESAKSLQKQYDNLYVVGVVDTYDGGMRFVNSFDNTKKLFVFLGSSFGNFDPSYRETFLENLHHCMRQDDFFLLGVDLIKNEEILENAYDDKKGVTAKFNLNLLDRINRDLGADFDLDCFEHRAVFNKKEGRMEMYLRSKVNQKVNIPKANLSVDFKKDELILTEHSHKFTTGQIRDIAQKSGFRVNRMWTDKDEFFALILLSKS